jgi:hypothetical protein
VNERRTFRLSDQNVPAWELYQNQFSNRFGWTPSVHHLSATECTMQRDLLGHYRGAGRTWSLEDALAGGRHSSQFTDQQSDQFAQEFLEFQQAQQHALRQPVIGHQVYGQHGMPQRPQIPTQQQQIPQQWQSRLLMHQQIQQALSRANSSRQSGRFESDQ